MTFGRRERPGESLRRLSLTLQALGEALADAAGGLVSSAAMAHPDRVRVSVNAPARPGGEWRICIRKNGQVVSRRKSGTTDRAEAERIAQELQAQHDARTRTGQRERPAFADLYRLFLAEREQEAADGDLAPQTAKSYRNAWPHLEAFPDEPTTENVTVFLRQLEGPLRPRSADLYLQHARACWNWARAQGLVQDPWPAPRRKRSRRAAAKRQPDKRPFEPAQLAAILAHVRQGPRRRAQVYYPVLRVLAEVGARSGEPCACDVRHVTVDGHGLAWLELPETKDATPRQVPLLPDTLELLDLDRPKTAPLFPGLRRRRITRAGIYHALVKALAELGLREEGRRQAGHRPSYRTDAHSFRRSWIADAKQAHVDVLLQELVTGHYSANVHDRYARGATGRDLHGAVARVRSWRAEAVARLARKTRKADASLALHGRTPWVSSSSLQAQTRYWTDIQADRIADLARKASEAADGLRRLLLQGSALVALSRGLAASERLSAAVEGEEGAVGP